MATRAREGGHPRDRHERVACSVLGCPNDTNNRKPYCIDHLDRLPYVRKVRAEIALGMAEEGISRRTRELLREPATPPEERAAG